MLNSRMSDPAAAQDSHARFQTAIERFDEENSRDPNVETTDAGTFPRELLYARRLAEWVCKLNPGASEELRLAARCQHICRWTIPRESYPMTRVGYLKWRQDLKEFHARKSGEILGQVGYPPEMIQRVQALNLKRNLATDPDVQTLEDALCLVFLEHQLGPLLEKTSEDKVITALQKSWAKMTPQGREAALGLAFPQEQKRVLEKALGPGGA
jgi:hypothetical protein